MIVLCERTVAVLHRRLDLENDSSFAKGCRTRLGGIRFFREFMTVADLYRLPVQRFDFHREQRSLS